MSTLVESFKRLYTKQSLTKEQMVKRVEKGTITAKEYQYITNEEYVLPGDSTMS